MTNQLVKVADIGKNIAKSFFTGSIAPSTQIIAPGDYRRGPGNLPSSGYMFDQMGGYDVYFSYSGLQDVVKAYECCPPVYSIINKQAYAFTNGKTFILNSKGKESNSEYAKKIRKLLAKPNALQNWKQFEAQIAIYIRLFGYCIILPIIPVTYDITDASALWIIPPYMCEFDFSKQTFFNMKKGFIKSVKIRYGDEETVITDMDKLIFLKDITPGFDTLFLPSSPVKPLQQNISNLIGIYNSKGMLINYRGALGILSPEVVDGGAIALDPDEEQEMQDKLMVYGLMSGQRKFIFANAAMKWQQMGIPYKDLCLTEWAEDDTMVIADGLNYPFQLLSNNISGNLGGSDKNEFKKQLYQDFVIPFGEMIYEQLGEALMAPENNCTIVKDYSHVPCMQEDDLKKAQSRVQRNNAYLVEFQNNMITLNDWRLGNNEDPLEGEMAEFGKMYYYQLVEKGFTFGGKAMTLTVSDGSQTSTTTSEEPKNQPKK